MTFIDTVEQSRNYINDKNVVNFINNNKHVLSISTISDPKNYKFGLEIETSSKDASVILMRNGMKLSNGDVIKMKVNYVKDEEYKEDIQDEEDNRENFCKMPSFGKFYDTESTDQKSDNRKDDRMHNKKFNDFIRTRNNNHPNTWMSQQADNLDKESSDFGFGNSEFNSRYGNNGFNH